MEWRQLWSPASLFPQSRVSLLVEILPAAEARLTAPLPVARPAPVAFEIRVVVWGVRGVPAMNLGGFNDLYVRGFLVGGERGACHTDTHLRSEGGRGSFNYRLKFPVTLPLPA